MGDRASLTQVSVDNRQIIKENGYDLKGRHVELPGTLEEHQEVLILRSERLDQVMGAVRAATPDMRAARPERKCVIDVRNEDSLEYPTDMVLNFANAVEPGGGYLRGATAQEECLCRQTTLYASIASEHASWVYDHNKQFGEVGTDIMLFSPYVAVFRDADNQLLDDPRETSVLTSAAPNLYKLYPPLSHADVDEIMYRRIMKVLCAAAALGERRITLGAWGCGAFGHDPTRTAGLFRRALVDEAMDAWFDVVVFAVLATSGGSANLRAFEEAFQDVRARRPEEQPALRPLARLGLL